MGVTKAAYPVVKGLQAKAVGPLAGKAVALAATGDPTEIIKTIDAGLDAFLSVPPERFFATAMKLKSATAAAAVAPSCNLVCVPPIAQVEEVVEAASDAITVTNPDKLKRFLFQGAMSLASGDKQQYAGVLAESIKFSFSLNKADLERLKDSVVSLLIAIDNAQSAVTPPKLRAAKAFPKNAAVEQISLDLADGLYPIVGGLQAKAVGPLAGKAVALAATGDPKEIIKTIDAGLDAFLSVPPERFVAAAAALKSATAEAANVRECNLVCMPPLATVERVAGKMANALSVTDSEKLKVFIYQAIRSLQSGNQQQLAALVSDGRKFEATLNEADLRRTTTAAVDLLAAAGAPLSPSERAWVVGFVGLSV